MSRLSAGWSAKWFRGPFTIEVYLSSLQWGIGVQGRLAGYHILTVFLGPIELTVCRRAFGSTGMGRGPFNDQAPP
jgi:hypothetical protein